jgi:hypothetical protein
MRTEYLRKNGIDDSLIRFNEFAWQELSLAQDTRQDLRRGMAISTKWPAWSPIWPVQNRPLSLAPT